MKKLIYLIAIISLFVIFFPKENAEAATVTASGTCGDNATWSLDSDGTLTISGSGKMSDYDGTYDSNNQYCTTAPYGTCSGEIKKVVITDGIENIGNFAFFGCNSMSSVTISDTITSIGNHAFHSSGLTSVTISESITSIGDYAFASCTSLQSVTISDGAASIGESCFYNCNKLTSVIIPNSVASIGNLAFVDCNSLKSITITNATVTIGNNAFGLISDSINIGKYKILSDFTLHGYSGSTAENYASSNDITFIDLTAAIDGGKCGDNVTWSLNGEGTLTISGSGKMYDYVGTYDSNNQYCNTAPYGNYSNEIINVVITDGIENIGSEAFYGLSKINNVTISDSVISIGRQAFCQCSSLTDITLPKNLLSIGNGAFMYCSGLLNIIIPDSVTTIEGYAFVYCNNLTSLIIPKNVTSMGECAFGSCSGLKSVIISEGVTSIGKGCFFDCNGLTKVTIPISVTNICDQAFYRCDSLNYIVVPNNLATIGDKAIGYTYSDGTYKVISDFILCGESESTSETYAGDNGLNFVATTEVIDCDKCGDNITWLIDGNGTMTLAGTGKMANYLYATGHEIPAPYYSYRNDIKKVAFEGTITQIGSCAFSGLRNLNSVTIPESVHWIYSQAFCGCTSLTDLVMSDNVWQIGQDCFVGCGFTSLTLSKGLSEIPDRAFLGCSLTSIEIPEGVKEIGDTAFGYCSNLNNVSIPGSLTSIGRDAFMECDSLKVVTIPSSVTTISYHAFGEYYDLSASGYKLYEDFVMYGESGSTAEAYAKDNSLIFTALSDTENKITYVLDGATNADANPISYTDGSTITLADPTKEGSIFQGWYTDYKFTNKVTSISSEMTGNVILYAKWFFVYSFSGYQMTIDTDFNLKYFLKLGDEVLNSSTTYMKFVVGDDEKKTYICNSSDDDYVSFLCDVPAKQVGDTISAYLVYDGTEYHISDYSVAEYLNVIITNKDNNAEYSLAKDLAKSILDYAAYSQVYFDYNTDKLVNKNVTSDPVASLTDSDVTNAITISIKGTLSNSDFTYYGASLVCDSSLHLKLYLNNTNKLTIDEINNKYDFEVIGDGAGDVTVVADGSFAYVEIEGIPSYALNTYYDISADGIDIKYSPYTYIKDAMSSENTDLKNLCKALYLYNIEADEYYTGKAL